LLKLLLLAKFPSYPLTNGHELDPTPHDGLFPNVNALTEPG
jgi:hypothetical protein